MSTQPLKYSDENDKFKIKSSKLTNVDRVWVGVTAINCAGNESP